NGKSMSMAQVPITRGWTVATMGGPWGTWSGASDRPGPAPGAGTTAAGWPPTSTRAAGISHFTVTHGCGAPATLNGHPTTVMRLAMVATGCPLTSTRGCEGTMVAGAACGHWITALVWSRNPGMNALSSGDGQR